MVVSLSSYLLINNCRTSLENPSSGDLSNPLSGASIQDIEV